jgi:dihydrolipoamide dehydrogenase
MSSPSPSPSPSNMAHVDVAIIGTGTAGMRAYVNALKHTQDIAVIEGHRYGTTCARVGCMPSKLLIAPAEARHRVSQFKTFGLEQPDIAVDGAAVMERVKRERDRFVGFVEARVEQFDPAHRVLARAEFEDDHTLLLHCAEGKTTRLHAERIVIATGSTPVIPELLRQAGPRLATSDDVFYWNDLPRRVAVVGTGIIGLELGQALHRLGVEVVLFGRSPQLGILTDPVMREKATAYLKREMPLEMATAITQVRETDAGVEVTSTDAQGLSQTRTFDVLLAATGRVANVAGLHLERTSLVCDEAGIPLFNAKTLQCQGAPHVFIAGDATADHPLLHVAGEEGLIAGQNAGTYPHVQAHTRKTPLTVAFTEPQIALAGATHRELKAQGIPFVIGEKSFDDQGRARVFQINQGHLRVYAHAETGRILGAEMIGPGMEHLAHLLAWAIGLEATVSQLIAQPFYHPTLEEGLLDALRDCQ